MVLSGLVRTPLWKARVPPGEQNLCFLSCLVIPHLRPWSAPQGSKLGTRLRHTGSPTLLS